MIHRLHSGTPPGLYLLAQAGSPRMLVLPTEGKPIGINLDPWRDYVRYTAHVLRNHTSISALMMAPLDRGRILLQLALAEHADDPGIAVMGPEMIWGIRCLLKGGGTKIFWMPDDYGMPWSLEWTGETLSFYWTITRDDADQTQSVLFRSGERESNIDSD